MEKVGLNYSTSLITDATRDIWQFHWERTANKENERSIIRPAVLFGIDMGDIHSFTALWGAWLEEIRITGKGNPTEMYESLKPFFEMKIKSLLNRTHILDIYAIIGIDIVIIRKKLKSGKAAPIDFAVLRQKYESIRNKLNSKHGSEIGSVFDFGISLGKVSTLCNYFSEYYSEIIKPILDKIMITEFKKIFGGTNLTKIIPEERMNQINHILEEIMKHPTPAIFKEIDDSIERLIEEIES